jgi:hypothetical protein
MVTARGVSGMVFILALFLHQVQKFLAGAAFVPSAVATSVMGGFVARRMIQRIGVKPVMAASMVVQAAGLLILGQPSAQGGYLPWYRLAWDDRSLPGGPGRHFRRSGYRGATSATSKAEEGIASGLVNTSQQMGGSIGLAILLTIAASFVHNFGSGEISSSAILGFHYAFVGGAVPCMVGLAGSLSLFMENDSKNNKKR